MGRLIWALLGAPGPFWGRSRWSFFKALVQNGLQEAFWIDFGRIWDGFARILKAFGEGLGKILLHFWKGFGKIWKRILRRLWTVFDHFFEYFLNWDPRAASLRPAKRHNARGSSTSLRVGWAAHHHPHSSPVGKASPLLEEGTRIPPSAVILLLLGAFFVLVRYVSHFFRTLMSASLF